MGSNPSSTINIGVLLDLLLETLSKIFFASRKLPGGVNDTLISLIGKVDNSESIVNFIRLVFVMSLIR